MDGSGADSGPAEQVVDEINAAGGDGDRRRRRHLRRRTRPSALIQTAVDTFGSLDILVNAAGILRDRMIFNMSEQEWDDVIRVHLKGHFNTIQAGRRLLARAAQPGRRTTG